MSGTRKCPNWVILAEKESGRPFPNRVILALYQTCFIFRNIYLHLFIFYVRTPIELGINGLQTELSKAATIEQALI